MKRHVEIISNGLTLRGYLQLPDFYRNKFPLVCMFHGFTGNKMEDHFYFVRLSQELGKRGIASLRMDFGNSGESDGEFLNMTPEGELIDARKIINYGKTIAEIDSNKIGIIGFSMGGMIASILAAEMKETIKALCLMSPAGNMENIMGQFFEGVQGEIADINGLAFSKKSYEQIKNMDPFEKAKNYDKKVLIIHGTNDQVVPAWVIERYKNIYCGKSECIYIRGANHIYSNMEWENQLKDATVDFFTKELN